ncbi:MAG: UvrD-helicase domain-containing protein [Leptospiraceae bacterium]|nr:UvrD-helicase domain-containing protein [Leptospiraceae bacterium]MDW7976485.1 UvrD-helicase domain-containing protein [Leptospiraceae bacterium]
MLEKNSFSKKQWKIIHDDSPYKQIVAAAGSGKTKTVIGYTIKSIEENEFLLLLSFSRKACGELRSRLPKVYHPHVEIRTFHAFCYHYIKKYHPTLSKSGFRILLDEQKEKFIENLILSDPKKSKGIPYEIIVKKLNHLKQYHPELFEWVYREIQHYKKENHFLEFEDLIEIVLEGLKNQEEWVSILKETYQNVIVDEFQDTDPRQLYFLSLLQPKKLFVVGDDWQAIYGFRGATVEPFLKFRKFFHNAKVFYLNENFRSLEPIVKLGNHVISYSSKKIPKIVRTIRKQKSPHPVLSFEIQSHKDVEKIVNYVVSYQAMILVRSNYRKNFWLQNGVPLSQVMTIHKSKGLEFPVVFLDLAKGWSGEEFLTDEEIRVLYVGITRAKNLCIILYEYHPTSIELKIFRKVVFKKTENSRHQELEAFLAREKEQRI